MGVVGGGGGGGGCWCGGGGGDTAHVPMGEGVVLVRRWRWVAFPVGVVLSPVLEIRLRFHGVMPRPSFAVLEHLPPLPRLPWISPVRRVCGTGIAEEDAALAAAIGASWTAG